MPDNRKPLIYGAFPVCRNYTVRAYVRDTRSRQRRGRENGVLHAGPLLGGFYTGHLYAHHQRYAERCGRKDRRLHGIRHGNAYSGTSRPAGGKPVQGDPVRKGGIKETMPKGQDYVPWASASHLNGNSLIFCAKANSILSHPSKSTAHLQHRGLSYHGAVHCVRQPANRSYQQFVRIWSGNSTHHLSVRG